MTDQQARDVPIDAPAAVRAAIPISFRERDTGCLTEDAGGGYVCRLAVNARPPAVDPPASRRASRRWQNGSTEFPAMLRGDDCSPGCCGISLRYRTPFTISQARRRKNFRARRKTADYQPCLAGLVQVVFSATQQPAIPSAPGSAQWVKNRPQKQWIRSPKWSQPGGFATRSDLLLFRS